MSGRRLILGIIGDASPLEGTPGYGLARQVGRLAVDVGLRIACGGLGGVMEAACRGAHESERYREGDTIGLLPGFDPADANRWVDIPIPTGLDHLRNGLVAASDAVIAIGGGAGTLSELAFAWMYKRPIVALGAGGWSEELAGRAIDHRRREDDPAGPVVMSARTAEEAVELAVSAAKLALARHGGVVRRR